MESEQRNGQSKQIQHTTIASSSMVDTNRCKPLKSPVHAFTSVGVMSEFGPLRSHTSMPTAGTSVKTDDGAVTSAVVKKTKTRNGSGVICVSSTISGRGVKVDRTNTKFTESTARINNPHEHNNIEVRASSETIIMAGRYRRSCKSLLTSNRQMTGKPVGGAIQCSSRKVDRKRYLQLKSPDHEFTLVADSGLDPSISRTPLKTVTSAKTDDSAIISTQKSIKKRNGSDFIRVPRMVSGKACGRRVEIARTRTKLTESTASVNNPLSAEHCGRTSLPVIATVCRRSRPLRSEAKGIRATNDDLEQPAASAATSDVNNTPITLTSPDSKSQEEIMEITKQFCQKLDRLVPLVANVYYSDIDRRVHVEVVEQNKPEAETVIKQLEEQYQKEKGYCPSYVIELFEAGEYKQTCSPRRTDENHPTTSRVVQDKPTARPGTQIVSSSLRKSCLFSGALTDKLGISVAHAFEINCLVEHQSEAFGIGRCDKLFASISYQENKSIPADIAFIEIDSERCNADNVIFWPEHPSQRHLKIYRGGPVPGDTPVMILNQHGEFKRGYIRREQVITNMLEQAGQHNMLAISSEKEYMRQLAITVDGDSGALVMSVPSSGGNDDIEVYGIVTGLYQVNSSSLTVASDLPQVLHILSELGELPKHADFK